MHMMRQREFKSDIIILYFYKPYKFVQIYIGSIFTPFYARKTSVFRHIKYRPPLIYIDFRNIYK